MKEPNQWSLLLLSWPSQWLSRAVARAVYAVVTLTAAATKVTTITKAVTTVTKAMKAFAMAVEQVLVGLVQRRF